MNIEDHPAYYTSMVEERETPIAVIDGILVSKYGDLMFRCYGQNPATEHEDPYYIGGIERQGDISMFMQASIRAGTISEATVTTIASLWQLTK